MFVVVSCVFFFKQKTAYERRSSDWSSDVCSSDLRALKNERLGDGSYDFSETPLLEAAMTLAARGNHVTEPLLSLAASLFPDSIRSFQTKARIHVLEDRKSVV